MNEPGRAIYSISAVARMLGLPAATLRTWEDRYGLVVPERNASGRRLYRRDQVAQLRFVKNCVSDGTTAADAHRLLAERIESGAPVTPEAESGPGLLILLADNDPYAAGYAEYFLKTEGYQVEVASTDEMARRSFGQRPPSLVVVDLLLSGGTGLDLCRSFKQQGDVPVIAVSVLEARDEALDAGADAFMLKPLQPLQLVSTARDLLRESALLRDAAETVL